MFNLATVALAVALKITLLGTGNPRPMPERYGPSILVEAATTPPTRILIDAGRGAAERLFTVGGRELLSGVDLVLLTHLHSDHVVGLPDLWLTGWLFGKARPLSLKGPEGTAAMMGHLEKAFEFDVKTRRDLDERLPGAGAPSTRATCRWTSLSKSPGFASRPFWSTTAR